MNTRLISALLVAVSASVAAPAFARESTVTRAARVKLVVVSVMLPMALYRSSAYTF